MTTVYPNIYPRPKYSVIPAGELICSVIIPSRGRPDGLLRAIHAVFETGKTGRVDVRVRLDTDDEITIARLGEIECIPNVHITFGPRLGYGGLNILYTQLAEESPAKWIWIGNDDAFIYQEPGTEPWDIQLEKLPLEGFIVQPEHDQFNTSKYSRCAGGPFPVVPNGSWAKVASRIIPDPVDTQLHSILAIENKWNTYFLNGVIKVHIRDNDENLVVHRAITNPRPRISFVGLGKLGLPVALAIQAKGYDVLGYDINPARFTRKLDTVEENIETVLNSRSGIEFTDDLNSCVNWSDVIFVAVQTPHHPDFEGITTLTPDRSDFDYSYLVEAIKQINQLAFAKPTKTIVNIISTVLPGTIRREILPIIGPHIDLCYNPYFIAMGTVIRDFYEPEFILLGHVSTNALAYMKNFYSKVINNNAPVFTTTLENAEMIKVSYNTFIGMKICLANTIMEMCHKLPGTNCDQVIDALSLSNRRLISPAYLRGGQGDGGGCHPRDNIAMSWLANKLNLSYNLYDSVMICREKQAEYIANIIEKTSLDNPGIKIFLFGKAFKPNTNLITGSPAVLVANLLKNKHINIQHHIDPIVDTGDHNVYDNICTDNSPVIIALLTQHYIFKNYEFPSGSIIIDPFRYYNNVNENNKVISIGIGPLCE
jgi:UDPglucose 6-dehydrogenase